MNSTCNTVRSTGSVVTFQCHPNTEYFLCEILTRLIFNSAVACMRPSDTTFLPVLAGITPPDIRREARVAKITTTDMNNSDHLLHHKVTAVDAACPQRLVSRRPFSRHAARLSNDNTIIVALSRSGMIAPIAAHPSFRQPALSLDMCYLLGQISSASSG